MKNLLPVTKVPFENDRTLSGYTTASPRVPLQQQPIRGFSHVLLAQFLSRMSVTKDSQADSPDIYSGQIEEQTIRRVAYFRFLERLEIGIPGCAEDDWKYAEETLKKQMRNQAY